MGAPGTAFAEELVGGTVTEISLEGLRRTREEVVYDLLEVEVGDPVTPGLFLSIEETLQIGRASCRERVFPVV